MRLRSRQRAKRLDDTVDEELRQLIKAEGEATRRHFDVVAEKMTSERNLALDQIDGDRAAGSPR